MHIIIRFLVVLLIISCSIFSQENINETQKVKVIDPFEEAVNNSKSYDPYIRRQAAEQFGVLRDQRALPYLKILLKDENPFVRQAALDSLGLLRAKEAIDDILYVLINDKEPQVRQSAVVAFGYIGIVEDKVIDPLIDILRDEKEINALKYAVCNTLSILRSTKAVSALVELLNTQDINLRRSVVYTLGKISHPDGIKALRDSIEKNLENEAVVSDIIKVLVEVSDVVSLEKFKVLYSTPSISQSVKFYLAYALAKLEKDTKVINIIKSALKSSQEEIKNLAIDAIRFIGDKESLDLLKEMQKKETSAYTKQLLEIAIKQLEQKYPPSQKQQQKEKK